MIDPWLYGGMTALAVLTGFIDAIAGGGGLIMLPALITAGLPPLAVLGTNKVQSMCGTGMAAWRFRKAGLVNFRPHRWTIACVFAGAVAGALTVGTLNPRALALVVPALLLAAALYTLLSPRMHDEDAPPRLSERGYRPVGAGIGFYDGFFGPGAGQFYALSLVSLRGLGLTRATALTKPLNVTSNLASAVVFALGGQVWWGLGLCMAAGAMTGAWLGAHTASRHGARLIRPLLVIASVALTGRLVWQWFSA